MTFTWTIFLIIGYLTIASISTWLIVRSKHYSKKQVRYQILISWIFPFVGGIVLIVVNRKEKPMGSHFDKIPSWKRLVKYDEHNEA